MSYYCKQCGAQSINEAFADDLCDECYTNREDKAEKQHKTISKAIYYISLVLETLDMDNMDEIERATKTIGELRAMQESGKE